ncbi:5-oxoprolinase subunit PxpB [Bacillus sp. 165]|uniref:5-oxoprolinase subunit PxpB n=1 Tax=Bacillus sp. 165 TaxID=1529117 RepID=UPI001ADB2E10|nr:5-oxoprolinase subunit PxpB [Bacillus sp. 165]MBO9131406.1 5-oxoprolinase subunit PxpB [Bacillus sp. 165]
MDQEQFSPLGDSGIVISMGDCIDRKVHEKVMALTGYLEKYPLEGMIEIVPGFTTVAVFYDPIHLFNLGVWFPYEWVLSRLKEIVVQFSIEKVKKARVVEIPVCYGGEFGPDLEAVAKYSGLTRDEVICVHSEADYLVYMIGFAPGFPYLGGMDKRIATPRRRSPRLTIPEGSVGIGGEQTGVYPIESPGGWQLIGRTPLSLFRFDENQPSLLCAGDIVRFRPITKDAYNSWNGKIHVY